MKLLFTLLSALLLLPGVSMAQNGSAVFKVKGIVADSLTSEGEPYATIRITKKGDSGAKPVLGVTDVKGRFSETVKGEGDYTLSVASMGRAALEKNFTLKAGQTTADLGTLYVTDDSKELKGVEVVAQKPLVKADLDKIAYDIEADPDSKTNTLIEMLRKVPMVTVDGEDNIKVNGNSSFKVYVNGKPNSMMSNNPKEVLKSMPANTIKSIEVITNPGPKYDAEGVGGILNIITVGGGMEGYSATLNAQGGNRHYGGGAFVTAKKGKFTVSGRYNYSKSNSPRSWSDYEMTALGDNISSSTANIKSESSYKGDGDFQSGSIEASYEIDTLRLVTMSVNMWGGGYDSNGNGSTIGSSPTDNSMLYRYNSLTYSKNSWYSIEGGIDYQRLFKVKDRMLTLSYRVETNPTTSDAYSDYKDMDAAPDWTDFIKRMENQYNAGEESTTEHTFQVDYTTPIGKIHTLEGGMKYILRDNRSDNDRYIRAAAQNTEYTFDENQSSHYKHQSDIAAAYLGYGLKLKKWSGRLGVRYEHTEQDVKYLLGRGENFGKSFNDIVPSASIGLKLSDFSNIRFGYNMRIYRPGIWYLNPYLDDSNPTSISQGNSNLESEKSHKFDLTFSSFTNKFNINVSLGGGFTNNSIERVSTLVNDNSIEGLKNPTGKDVIYSSYANIGKKKAFIGNLYLNWNITSSTRFFSNINGGWMSLSDGNDLENHGWGLSAYGGLQQTLPKDWNVSMNFYGSTPQVSLQGKSNGYTFYSMSVNKQFLKKRLTVSVSASNFFNKYNTYKSTTETAGFMQRSNYKTSQRYFSINLSYRIGELKASVKKAERSISNDDVKGGGQGNGGGGGK